MAVDTTLLHTNPIIAERAVDETRPLRVAYIGAGISGIVAGIILPKLVPTIQLTIYDKNEDVGGTWLENKYPGCACDIPAHAYQLSFESNVTWSKFYAGAPEILTYWQHVADKYNLRRLIKFSHQCVEARWDDVLVKWHVKVKDLTTGHVFEDLTDVLITGQGFLNHWQFPDIKGLHNFRGKLMHSANWDLSYEPKENETVAVIGAGSSAIQIIPQLQKRVKHLNSFIRNPTWISSSFGHEHVRERNAGEDGNFSYTPSEISTWQSKPDTYLEYRRSVEIAMNKGYIATHVGRPELAGATQFFESCMRARLASKPELADYLVPTFPPFCRRLTPGPQYLEALCEPNVSVITSPISHVTATGITTTDDKHYPVDTLICATGFNTTFLNRLPIYNGAGVSLTERYAHRPESYLSITVDTFPNFFQSLGPNSGQVTGNYVVMIERFHTYMAQCLTRLSQSNVRTIEPRDSAVQGFTDLCEAYFKRTVFAARCTGWYKSPRTPGGSKEDGRVTALWPGSGLHALKALETVRWEDFVITYSDGKEMGWLGNGFARAEIEDDDDGIVAYLDEGMRMFGIDRKGDGVSAAAVHTDGAVNAGEDEGRRGVDDHVLDVLEGPSTIFAT